MALADLTDWMDEFSGPDFVWYAKRLSGNDTLANHSHQAGPYIPKEFLFQVFPSINIPEKENPDKWFDLYIDSHADGRKIRAIWYNNKLRGGTRNEARLTNFGGASSALLDPESTGALSVFSFRLAGGGEATECHAWVCRHETEEDLVEERIGPVEPGTWTIWTPGKPEYPGLFLSAKPPRASCWLEEHEIPPGWLEKFPTGAEIISKAVNIKPFDSVNPDLRMIKRRECEFEIFKSIEEAVELPLVRKGFHSIDEFIARAQTILQRRKARSGRSLELHARQIFIEEGLKENVDFSHQPESDPGKKPDFLFPSGTAYKTKEFPESRLRMLAVKTTCKDRWRQILNEAARIERKHLLTLQRGISENQFREMHEAQVQLVVPVPLLKAFPRTVQPHLQTFESFIGDVRLLNF
ncbi:MAG: type II restriction endonuclease [Desulfosarcina sp.]|nr:type II restriction endonuclease [Desulfosarcina sp.]